MSESELAAAICPYENGSSTIGVKKSTVCTSARCRSNRYTPASSNVFELTSTFRFNEMGSCGKTCRRACWLNFDAHPAQDESDVSFRICSRDIWVHLPSISLSFRAKSRNPDDSLFDITKGSFDFAALRSG